MENNAAHNLEGRTLVSGWKVIEKISKIDCSTGGNFSVCYKVKKDNKECFLKALDFSFFVSSNIPNESPMKIMKRLSNAFEYERDLSLYCKNEHVTKVALVVDSGEEMMNEFSFGYVPYLIFEMANGDVRRYMKFTQGLDVVWKLNSLHDIAIGIQQLHRIQVSHQDLKPSNILVFDKDSKLGDIGRSLCNMMEGPYDALDFSGEKTYAPPEVLYNYCSEDWYDRAFAIDCYMLGNLIIYYFTGSCMTTLIQNNLKPCFRVLFWRGTLQNLLPYLLQAHKDVLDLIGSSLGDFQFKSELMEMINQLCYPFPEKRGHPKNISEIGNNYTLDRYISKLNLLARKAKYTYTN